MIGGWGQMNRQYFNVDRRGVAYLAMSREKKKSQTPFYFTLFILFFIWLFFLYFFAFSETFFEPSSHQVQSRIQGPSQRVAVASHGASRMFCPSATHNLAYLCMRLYFKQQRSLSSWKAFPRHPPVTWAEEALSQSSTCNLTARSGPLMERGSLHVGLVRPCPALNAVRPMGSRCGDMESMT